MLNFDENMREEADDNNISHHRKNPFLTKEENVVKQYQKQNAKQSHFYAE